MNFEYQKLVKSRKEYNCKSCGEKILKGSMYFNITITPWCHSLNESYDNWKIHESCKDLGDEYYWDDIENGVFTDDSYQSEFREYKEKQLTAQQTNE